MHNNLWLKRCWVKREHGEQTEKLCKFRNAWGRGWTSFFMEAFAPILLLYTFLWWFHITRPIFICIHLWAKIIFCGYFILFKLWIITEWFTSNAKSLVRFWNATVGLQRLKAKSIWALKINSSRAISKKSLTMLS